MLGSGCGGQEMPGGDSGMSCGLVTAKTGHGVDWVSLTSLERRAPVDREGIEDKMSAATPQLTSFLLRALFW